MPVKKNYIQKKLTRFKEKSTQNIAGNFQMIKIGAMLSRKRDLGLNLLSFRCK
jgi:hypothetical protein